MHSFAEVFSVWPVKESLIRFLGRNAALTRLMTASRILVTLSKLFLELIGEPYTSAEMSFVNDRSSSAGKLSSSSRVLAGPMMLVFLSGCGFLAMTSDRVAAMSTTAEIFSIIPECEVHRISFPCSSR